MLEPGPNAQRSPTYFFQDGDHQEKLFRAIEASHPDIEHLGNWHTHHVNGYPTLSGGDKADLLQDRQPREAQHRLLLRAARREQEPRRQPALRRQALHLPPRRRQRSTRFRAKDVRLVDTPVLCPRAIAERARAARSAAAACPTGDAEPAARQGSGVLRRILSRPQGACSRRTSAPPTGRDRLPLVDGSRADVVAMEDPDDRARSYSIATLLQESGHRRHPRRSTRSANSARRGTPFCTSNAISIRRSIAARRGRGA